MTDTWLSLTATARRLGIHPTTLRRWANEGEIACMLTPGGHRRFLESDLQRFEERARREAEDRPSTQLVRWGEHAIDRTRQDLVHHPHEGWLAPLNDEARAQHRVLGQRLMALLLQFVSRETPGPEIEEEVRSTGHAYGEQARRHGLRLAQALSATMFFRESLSEAALAPPGALARHTEHNAQLLRRLNRFINLTQLAVVDAYDGTTAGT